ncbi:hypothetical protein HWD35_16265 [Tsukamurella tyrosinosolvens]|uniref:hypothetical protein n=1 Tax=Tsukamurella tyrosinosolvens TaxID=57704 RepID=UPI001CE142E5|nr:hypothetical protein [Tsukamurella tyrosinosolvens]MCA4996274.1 hypothetical protein [Tsukamurella tyrosinosolvens]
MSPDYAALERLADVGGAQPIPDRTPDVRTDPMLDDAPLSQDRRAAQPDPNIN